MFRSIWCTWGSAALTLCTFAVPASSQEETGGDRPVSPHAARGALNTPWPIPPFGHQPPKSAHTPKSVPCACGPAHTHLVHPHPFTRLGNPKVQILVDGKVLAERTGEPSGPPTAIVFPDYGTEYEIRIDNRAPTELLQAPGIYRSYYTRRAMFDIEVDGLSAMSGKPHSGQPIGYILGPNRASTIKGWRVNDDTVKRFVVSEPAESLSVKEGLRDRTGMIQVRVFPELSYDRPVASDRIFDRQDIPRSGSLPFSTRFSLGMAHFRRPLSSYSSGGAAGTTAGDEALSRVNRISFVPNPYGVKTIRFNYRVAKDASSLAVDEGKNGS